jgi:hypothetical protein
MNSYARVAESVVREIVTTESDITTLFHPSLTWVNVTGSPVRVGWIEAADGGFVAPPPPQLVPMPPRLADLVAQIAEIQEKLTLLHTPG